MKIGDTTLMNGDILGDLKKLMWRELSAEALIEAERMVQAGIASAGTEQQSPDEQAAKSLLEMFSDILGRLAYDMPEILKAREDQRKSWEVYHERLRQRQDGPEDDPQHDPLG